VFQDFIHRPVHLETNVSETGSVPSSGEEVRATYSVGSVRLS
jgi:hypothetical protein